MRKSAGNPFEHKGLGSVLKWVRVSDESLLRASKPRIDMNSPVFTKLAFHCMSILGLDSLRPPMLQTPKRISLRYKVFNFSIFNGKRLSVMPPVMASFEVESLRQE